MRLIRIWAAVAALTVSIGGAAQARAPTVCDTAALHQPVRPLRPSAGTRRASPSGLDGRCRDGTYSFSEHRRGTCSHHGGVAD
jgi:hypothetical protein